MSVGQRVVSAVGWSTGIKLVFQLVTWAVTLLVIRILSPDDYGLMAMSQVFINFMLGFSNLGLGDALIQREETSKPVLASVFALMLLASAALTLLLSFAAPLIAEWYHDPRLARLIQVASLGFLFNGLTTLPRVYLVKSLRIRPMFIMELSSGLVGSATVILLAYSGHGVWSLMLGWLAGNIARLAGFAVLTAEYFVWPRLDLKLIGPLLPFGMFRVLDYLAGFAFTSADVLIIGWWLGTADLGLYSVALNFAGMPLSKIAPIVNSVAFPAFAMVQGNPAKARLYALKAMRLMAAILVPVFFGISALAPEVVALVFGPQWLAAEPMLGVLALAMTFRAILLVIPNYLQGVGDARAVFWCTLTGALVFPPAFILSCAWGIMGVCYVWLLGYPFLFVVYAVVVASRAQLALGAVLLTPLRPMVAGGVMLLVVGALRPYLQSQDVSRAIILIAAGTATYIGIMGLAFRPLLLELASVIFPRWARKV